MAFTKGRSGNPAGRKPGTPNKLTATLKDIILQALSEAGGKDYLLEQSQKNPTAFMTLVGRVLPLQVNDKGGDPVMPTAVNHHIHTDPKP